MPGLRRTSNSGKPPILSEPRTVGLREECQAELTYPAGAEGAVGKVAMIARANREDPQQIQQRAERHGARPCRRAVEADRAD